MASALDTEPALIIKLVTAAWATDLKSASVAAPGSEDVEHAAVGCFVLVLSLLTERGLTTAGTMPVFGFDISPEESGLGVSFVTCFCTGSFLPCGSLALEAFSFGVADVAGHFDFLADEFPPVQFLLPPWALLLATGASYSFPEPRFLSAGGAALFDDFAVPLCGGNGHNAWPVLGPTDALDGGSSVVRSLKEVDGLNAPKPSSMAAAATATRGPA